MIYEAAVGLAKNAQTVLTESLLTNHVLLSELKRGREVKSESKATNKQGRMDYLLTT